jgi:hypothetical protein
MTKDDTLFSNFTEMSPIVIKPRKKWPTPIEPAKQKKLDAVVILSLLAIS